MNKLSENVGLEADTSRFDEEYKMAAAKVKAERFVDRMNLQSSTDIRMESDPIFGTLGSLQDPAECYDEEDCLEKRLAKMKPREVKSGHEHRETRASINWAENFLGDKFDLNAYLKSIGAEPPSSVASAHLADEMSSKIEYDEDIESTAQSALYAEMASKFEAGSLEEYTRCHLTWE